MTTSSRGDSGARAPRRRRAVDDTHLARATLHLQATISGCEHPPHPAPRTPQSSPMTREGGRCARAAPALLAHLNIFIAMYAGALLATGARLKWDPSTYVALRELLPDVYRAAAALAPAAALLLLAHAHLALAPLHLASHHARRALWLIYAVSGALIVGAEVGFGAWAARAVRSWMQHELQQHLQHAEEVRAHLLPLLAALDRWHPLPDKLKHIIEEVQADAPWNAYVAGGAALALLVAQLAAVALAVLARTLPPAPAPPPTPPYSSSRKSSSGEGPLLPADSR